MDITQIITHKEDAAKRLLYQYKDKPKIQALLDAYFGDQVQELEDMLWQLFSRLDLSGSSGIQLDRIGSIVGQPRLGLDDDLYRIWITARIGQNTSEGDIERVISIWRLFNPDAASIQLVEHFPAEVAIYSDAPIDPVDPADPVYGDQIFSFMQRVLGAGIRFGYSAVFDPDNAFGFAESTNSAGFGDSTNPDIGGELAYIELV